MTSIFSAITAAGVVYDRSDFADPQLSGPTALTVTADGRVFGHLAQWNVPHIGMGSKTTPPKSPSGYKYFHQGIVSTKDGDLPVGKLTLGTGHAPVNTGVDAVAAAAHYDNTGTVAAAVRAGEDQHGIWLAGRIVPGTSPERVDELRLSGVSGDWRGINGNYELVAALAVNVPGFPLPRTEELVAAGVPAALVAAGVVAPAGAPTSDELAELVSSAAAKVVDERLAAHRRREALASRMTALVASASADRRKMAVGRMQRLQASRALEGLTAAADSGIPGHLPKDLEQYWTAGEGLARWAESPHPYTALTRALRSEMPADKHHMVEGLAANLFKKVFGIFPGQREMTAAGGRRVRTNEGAKQYGVSIGDLIPQAVEQVRTDAGNAVARAGEDVAKFLDPKRGKTKPPAGKSSGPRAEAHTEQPAAKSDRGPGKIVNKAEPVGDAPKQKGTPAGDVADGGKSSALDEPPVKTAPAAKPKAAKDQPAKVEKSTVEKAGPAKPESTPMPDAKTPAGKAETKKATEKNPPKDTPTSTATAANAATAVGEGKTPEVAEKSASPAKRGDSTSSEPPKPTGDARPDTGAGAAAGGDAGSAAASYFPPDYPPASSSYADREVGSPIDTVAPARLADNAGIGGEMLEDEIPEVGANGGALVDYSDGMAIYEDGSVTDGTEWTAADSTMIENAAASRAVGMQEAFADDPTTIETDVPPRTSGYGVVMEEDQAPPQGANGGALKEYSDGVASYDDGTSTNGVVWSQTAAPEEDPILAPPPTPDQTLTAAAYRRAMRRIGLSTTPQAWR